MSGASNDRGAIRNLASTQLSTPNPLKPFVTSTCLPARWVLAKTSPANFLAHGFSAEASCKTTQTASIVTVGAKAKARSSRSRQGQYAMLGCGRPSHT